MDAQSLGNPTEDQWIAKYRAAIAAAPRPETRRNPLLATLDRALRVVSEAKEVCSQFGQFLRGKLKARLNSSSSRTPNVPPRRALASVHEEMLHKKVG